MHLHGLIPRQCLAFVGCKCADMIGEESPAGLEMLGGMLVVAPRRVRPSHPTRASSSACKPSNSQRLMPPPPLAVMPAVIGRTHSHELKGRNSVTSTAVKTRTHSL